MLQSGTRRNAVLLALGGLLALGSAIGPRAEASHQYAIYRCTGSYLVRYRHSADNAPAPLTDRCASWQFTAHSYLIKLQGGDDFSIVYLNPRTREYGIVQDCPEWDCQLNEFLCTPNRAEAVVFNCFDYDIDINDDATDDARRCEVLCLEGSYNPDGTPLPPPDGGTQDAPVRLTGSYCRVTCYDFGEFWYQEANFGRRDYSYWGPYSDNDVGGADVAAIACVTGKLTCTMDKRLTSIWLDDLDDLATAETTITDYLDGLGWTSVGTRDCVTTQATPFDYLTVEPFCP